MIYRQLFLAAALQLIGYLILLFLTQHFLLNVTYISGLIGDTVSIVDLERQLSFQQRWIGWTYPAFMLFWLLRVLIVSLAIYGVAQWYRLPLHYLRLVRIVVLAEYLFLFAAVLRFSILLYDPPQTFQEFSTYQPLSLLSLLPHLSTVSSIVYLLQTINLFELLYWIFLALSLKRSSRLSFDRCFQISGLAYVPMLATWVILVSLSSMILKG